MFLTKRDKKRKLLKLRLLRKITDKAAINNSASLNPFCQIKISMNAGNAVRCGGLKRFVHGCVLLLVIVK